MTLVLNHEKSLTAAIRSLRSDKDESGSLYSDVAFKVEGVVFRLHRVILAAQSSVFRAMLTSTNSYFLESNETKGANNGTPVVLPGKKSASFKYFIDYLYSGRLDLSIIDLKDQLEVFDLANEYDVGQLFSALIEHFMKNLLRKNIANALPIFERAMLYYEVQPILYEKCLRYINANATSIVSDNHFSRLPINTVRFLIAQDEFAVEEVEILRAVLRWYDCHPYVTCQATLFDGIRFGNIDGKQLTEAERSRVDKHLEDHPMSSKDNSLRFYAPIVNMATLSRGATMSPEGRCQNGTAVLQKASEGGYAQHSYGEQDGSIIIIFARPIMVSSMRLILGAKSLKYTICLQCGYEPDLCNCQYSYKIFVSKSQEATAAEWFLLADCSKKLCRNSQLILFPMKQISLVKIIGVIHPKRTDYCTFNDVFCCTRFECPAVDESGEALLIVDNSLMAIKGSATSYKNRANDEIHFASSVVIEQNNWPNHLLAGRKFSNIKN